jgi:hypothetical protein
MKYRIDTYYCGGLSTVGNVLFENRNVADSYISADLMVNHDNPNYSFKIEEVKEAIPDENYPPMCPDELDEEEKWATPPAEEPSAQDILAKLRSVKNERRALRNGMFNSTDRDMASARIGGILYCIEAIEEMIEESKPQKWYWWLGDIIIAGPWDSIEKAKEALKLSSSRGYNQQIPIVAGGNTARFIDDTSIEIMREE